MGLKPLTKKLQLESMDGDLKNSLWNALNVCYWENGRDIGGLMRQKMKMLMLSLYIYHYKEPVEYIESYWQGEYEHLRKKWQLLDWSEIYDFVEFVANNYSDEKTNNSFVDLCNKFLEREFSAYRFVGKQIVPITNEIEIKSIEEALEKADKLKPVKKHLQNALDSLGDRNDESGAKYKNSIKDSTLAVEAMLRLIVKNENVTLGKALTEIRKKGQVEIHPALEKAFGSLYGYSSDGGIRHAQKAVSTQGDDFEEAKFMVVACSAFINYLLGKCPKAGVVCD